MRETRYKLAVFVPSNAVVYISEGIKETDKKKVSGTTVIIEHGEMGLFNFIASPTDDSVFGLYRIPLNVNSQQLHHQLNVFSNIFSL